MRIGRGGAAIVAIAVVAACADEEAAPPAAAYDWHLPVGFPVPLVPADNPMSPAKVDLGRHLFYDRRLSDNRIQACASCHQQQRGFTDGLAGSVGSTGQHNRRGAMPLANVAYAAQLTWANDLLPGLEEQALVPMFGETPVELGLAGKDDEVLARLAATPYYPDAFARAFPGESAPITIANVTKAIAAFERTLISGNSPWDQATTGGRPEAVGDDARRGHDLFFGERLECHHCHGGFAMYDATRYVGKTIVEEAFHNTGLYDLDGLGAYPMSDRGLLEISGKAADMGRFKAPGLRNVAVTGPYMHDGSVATLDEALDHYAHGGRVIASGPDAGDGSKSPLKSELVRGFLLGDEERADTLAFLNALTDQDFLTNPAFSDPWPAEAP